MKYPALIVLCLQATLSTKAQTWTSLPVEGDTCSLPIDHVYTRTNHTSGTGSSYNGYYKIYKDGVLVYTSATEYAPPLQADLLYVRSSDMVVVVETWGGIRRTTDGMTTFPQFSWMYGFLGFGPMYFPSEDLGYAALGGGMYIQRIQATGPTILFQSTVPLIADTVVHDTVPAFVSCIDVDTLIFPIRFPSGDTARVIIAIHQLPVAVNELEHVDDCQLIPVPASSDIRLSCPLIGNVGSYYITTIDGRLVMQGDLRAITDGIGISALDDGVYLIVLVRPENRTTLRFVKSG